jgi:DNA gyrase subunit B
VNDNIGNIGGNGGSSKRLAGVRLAQFLEKVEAFRVHLDKLVSRGWPADALKIALKGEIKDKGSLADPARLARVAERLEAAGYANVLVGQDEEHGTGFISLVSKRDGVEREVKIDWSLVTSGEYRALAQNVLGLEAIAASSLTLIKGEEASIHDSLDEALEKLYSGAKKGLSIQRYKGLGEMNPEQLWETTMDPEKRRLLQVRIEDDVEADSIFTVLMGDEVEPRREFIQANALDVRNLDV